MPEFIADKLPQTPPRLSPPGLAVRLAAGGTGAFVLAKRERADRASAAVTGALGAAAGSFGGYRWRQWAGGHMPDWQAALAEDAIALSLAIAAFRDGGRS
ncbi:hypothetical protein [Rhodococcus jostii]|uniref:hypothetical protein n=1 Tax=Rhodococcus jostii TaxID=132919 RepID=UPI00363446FC